MSDPAQNSGAFIPTAAGLPLAVTEGISRVDAASRLLPKAVVPDHELIRVIGKGAYGEVWLARNIFGEYRAVKVIWRREFGEEDRPFQREFEGIKRFEPISRSHPSQLAILHVGKNEQAGCFYYVMELADPVSASNPKSEIRNPKQIRNTNTEEGIKPETR